MLNIIDKNERGSTVTENSKKFKSNVSNSNSSSGILEKSNTAASQNVTSSGSGDSEDKGDEPKMNLNKTESTENELPSVPNKEIPTNEINGNKKELKQSNGLNKSSKSNGNDIAPTLKTNAPTKPPIPLLKGSLTYSVDQSRHAIRGYWHYENAEGAPKQRFEYLRNLPEGEDVTKLPVDGEYHGSFNIVHVHVNNKGKRKERNSMILETGVKIKFSKKEDKLYDVKGEGRNDYGTFEIYGTATKVEYEGDLSYDIVLRKNYLTTAVGVNEKKSKKKRKHEALNGDLEPAILPPPSESYPTNVICLKGKLSRKIVDDGGPQVIHRIEGMWSGGLDKLLEDPENLKGDCNPFDYEHRCSGQSDVFPLSGRYTGWFLLNRDLGDKVEKITVQERDVTLKFKKNNEGYYNVEGRGMNGFGKYTITGSLSKDDELTIFRHFQPVKQKAPKARHSLPKHSKITPPGGLAAPKLPLGRSNAAQLDLPKLSLNDVEAPDDSENPPAAMKPLDSGAFSVLSRGVLKIDVDGQHSCTGKWAISRDQFEEKKGSNFMFGLKSTDAIAAGKKMKGDVDDDKEEKTAAETTTSYNAIVPDFSSFPLDSDLYYGHFRMKRGSTKFTTIRDQQIVLKFRKNSVGSYNVYGLGVNELGKFDLVGTFLPRGEGSGQIELYRIYHPAQPTGATPRPISGKQLLTPSELSTARKQPGGRASLPGHIQKHHKLSKTRDSDSSSDDDSKRHGYSDPPVANLKSNSILPKSSSLVQSLPTSSISPLPAGLNQRTSSRQVKVPSRLEDDDPKALHSKIMERCSQVLRYLTERDAFAFFAQPVDPLALGIPTYHEVIKNPMDLGTIQKKMQANEVENHSEFGRLVRLVFSNAMTFNEDVTHRVHQNAKDMLSLFNQKFRDIEKEGEKLEELLKREKRGSKTDREAKRREKEASKEARKKQREEQRLKRKREKEDKQKGDKGKSKRPKFDDDGDYVPRSEFNSVVRDLRSMKKMLDLIVSQFASTGVKLEIPQEEEIIVEDSPRKEAKSMTTHKTSKSTKPKSVEEMPLSREEQIELTETINELPEDKLQGVMDILHEDMDVLGDDEEIDLEIDALKTSTQRKLQRYVRQSTKSKSKASKKKTTSTPVPKKQEPKKVEAVAEDNSDSDSDSSHGRGTKGEKSRLDEPPLKKEDDVFGHKDDADSDSDDSEFNGEFNFNNFKATNDDSDNNDASDDEDNDIADARRMLQNQSEKAKQVIEREKRVQKNAELEKQKRMKDMASQRDQILEQRKQEEAEEARLEEEKKKEADEAKKKTRDEFRNMRDNTNQEIDLELERKLMRDYEYNYGGDGSGSASPGSDFGF